MNVICLDIGTTAAKGAAFENGRRTGQVLKRPMPLRLRGCAAELEAEAVVRLAFDLIRRLGRRLGGRMDRIALATMCPAVCLLDPSDRPLTPILCHLDRRSEPQALEIASHFGQEELLAIAGNLPIPGGIASTLLRWMQTRHPRIYRQAARVAPLTTLIVSRLTGKYVCDPGTAAFLGTFDIRGTRDAPALKPWPAMLRFLQLPAAALPRVMDGGQVAGHVRPRVARQLGLVWPPEVLVGLMDTSAACLHAGLAVGHMYNVIGTTDVLAVCTDRPRPQRDLLTRPVGAGPLWLAINTMAAVGAALDWAHRTFFADFSRQRFFRLADRLGRSTSAAGSTRKEDADSPGTAPIRFEPDLAGTRMHVRQRYGNVKGLRLSTTRQQILAALMSGLAERSRRRLRVLARQAKPNSAVYLAGGASGSAVSRLWPARYKIAPLPPDAALQGLQRLASGCASGEG
jgi:xylulokinase